MTDKLTDSARKAVNAYLISIGLKVFALLGVANILAVWAGYDYVVDRAANAAEEAAQNRVAELQKPFEKVTDSTLQSVVGILKQVAAAETQMQGVAEKIDVLGSTNLKNAEEVVALISMNEEDIAQFLAIRKNVDPIKKELDEVVRSDQDKESRLKTVEGIATGLEVKVNSLTEKLNTQYVVITQSLPPFSVIAERQNNRDTVTTTNNIPGADDNSVCVISSVSASSIDDDGEGFNCNVALVQNIWKLTAVATAQSAGKNSQIHCSATCYSISLGRESAE